MKAKICIDGTLVKKLRENAPEKWSQEEFAILIGYNNKQGISVLESKTEVYIPYQILERICCHLGCSENYLLKDNKFFSSEEENDYLIISRKDLVELCEKLNCRMEDLVKEVGGKLITKCKEDLTTEYGTVKKGAPLQVPFYPKDYLSFLYKRMRGFSPNKLRAAYSILELLQDCEEDQVDTFVKISEAYFSVPLKMNVDNLREYIKNYVRNKSVPEILLSALDNTFEAKHSFLEEPDWNNKEFLKPLHQNLGDFAKASKRLFSLALTRSQVDCIHNNDKNQNGINLSESMNDSIDYLTEDIGHYLKSYIEAEHLSEGIPLKDMKEFKQGLPKYLTRDIKKNISVWQNALKNYSQRFK